MRRIVALVRQAEKAGIPAPTVQGLYDAAMRLGLDVLEANGKIPDTENDEQVLIPDLPEHRRGRHA
jgi:hypothetical protein